MSRALSTVERLLSPSSIFQRSLQSRFQERNSISCVSIKPLHQLLEASNSEIVVMGDTIIRELVESLFVDPAV